MLMDTNARPSLLELVLGPVLELVLGLVLELVRELALVLEQVPHRQPSSRLTTMPSELTIFSFSSSNSFVVDFCPLFPIVTTSLKTRRAQSYTHTWGL